VWLKKFSAWEKKQRIKKKEVGWRGKEDGGSEEKKEDKKKKWVE